MSQHQSLLATDILVVGAGPAGLAAAQAASDAGRKVTVLDDNPLPGGQIWRGGSAHAPDARARAALAALAHPNTDYRPGTRVIAAPGSNQLLVETPTGGMTLTYNRLILAGGARERLLPFPGWTLPGVTGAGGLQALVKGGWPIAGKRVVVAGSGPLLLAVAATLKARGAKVLRIAEQAPPAALRRFATGLARFPARLAQAVRLRLALWDVAYGGDAYVEEALGDASLHAVRLRIGAQSRTLEADYLACGYGLVPNLELAQALACPLATGPDGGPAVAVDRYQLTGVPDVFAAGELTGIGGVDKAVLEGRIAGLAAVGRLAGAEALLPARERSQAFARALAELGRLRPELNTLARPETLVCRCEDVSHGELAGLGSWREAKLLTRCGMGACQGRTCGVACATLFGWERPGQRPPLQPASLATLATACFPSPDRQPTPRPLSTTR